MLSTEKLIKAYSFLSHNQLATLCTVSEDGEPYAAVVYFTVDKNLNLYYITNSRSRKHKNVTTNQKVALAITDLELQITAQITGSAKETKDQKIIRQVVQDLMDISSNKVTDWPPPPAKLAGPYAVVRITPDWFRLGDFRGREHREGPSYFEQIIP